MNNNRPQQRTPLRGLCLAIVLLLPTICLAQSDRISVDAELSHRRAFVGDHLTYQITVRGADPDQPPTIEFPASVSATYRTGGQQTFISTQIINGKKQTISNNLHTYQYTLTILQPGTITIPKASVTINNKAYRSNQVAIDSRYPLKANEDEIVLDLDRSTLYVNESVPLNITWWIGNRNTSEFTFDSSIFPDSVTITPVNPITRSNQQYKIDIDGQQVIGTLDQPTRNGVTRTRIQLRVMLTPTKPGPVSLGPVRVLFYRIESNSTRYRAYAESDLLEINVIPVPETGKPAGYAGAIGNYSLTAIASNQSVNVGDPIELTLRIEGNEPMPGIHTGPNLNADPAFQTSFKVASEGWREDLPRRSSSRVYRTTIRALHDSITEVPSVKLAAFDPETGEYRILESNPIPIDVHAVREITLADALGTFSQSPQTPTDESSQVQSSPAGIWAHAPSEMMLDQDGFNLLTKLRSPVWISTMTVGPLSVCIFFIAARRRRSASPTTKALTQAWSQAKRLDAKGEHCKAIRTYLGAATGCDHDAFSSNDLDALELEEPLHAKVQQTLRFEEQSTFAQSPPGEHQESSTGLLAQLRRALARSTPTHTLGGSS